MSASQDRNLPATARRLQKAREEGQIARSRDLIHFVVLGGGLMVLSLMVPWGYERLSQGMRASFTFDHSVVNQQTRLTQVLADGLTQTLLCYLPLGILVALAVVVATVATGAYAFSTKSLTPDLSKLGLISGLQRMFSRQQFVEVLKVVVITTVLGVIAGGFVSQRLAEFSTLLSRPLNASLAQLGQWLTVGVGTLLAMVGILAAIDVPLQRFLHLRRLRMSLQEVKDEHKESDGNPQVKSKRRQRQRELAQRNSIAKVPNADLVVMNPTHYAVALRYDGESMSAPHVIAKGTDLIALAIRDKAKEHKVPVLESPMLARALYAHTEIDQQIPAALFTAVAQVLAYVYQLKAALRGEGPMPMQEPRPEVPVELDPHHGRPVAA